jgi:hydrogenase nickel incorporation protein HypB
MCGSCGCDDPGRVVVDVREPILAGNERAARANRERFERAGVLALNLMGGPGSGKTALLEATALALASRRRLGALAGDLATDRDARRLAAAGIDSASITTGQACHLDAALVERALSDRSWRGLDCLFVENVGNLVCPAIYDLGQAANVVALSVTEGEDKPLKYPVMFRAADLVVVTKSDLLPHLPDVHLEALAEALARVMPVPRWLLVSARTGDGMQHWLEWVEARRRELLARGEPARRWQSA